MEIEVIQQENFIEFKFENQEFNHLIPKEFFMTDSRLDQQKIEQFKIDLIFDTKKKKK